MSPLMAPCRCGRAVLVAAGVALTALLLLAETLKGHGDDIATGRVFLHVGPNQRSLALAPFRSLRSENSACTVRKAWARRGLQQRPRPGEQSQRQQHQERPQRQQPRRRQQRRREDAQRQHPQHREEEISPQRISDTFLGKGSESQASGSYETLTQINLRSSPDVAAPLTGHILKANETFWAKEVYRATDRSYLLVGKKGWAFDTGVAGDWIGRPIVERQSEERQLQIRAILNSPETPAELREGYIDNDLELMAKGLAQSMAAGVEELKKSGPLPPGYEDGIGQTPESLKRYAKRFLLDMMRGQSSSQLEEEALTPSNRGSGSPAMEGDARERGKKEEADIGNRPWLNEPAVGLPRWQLLAGLRWRDVLDKPKQIKPADPIGGRENVRYMPRGHGWRMGIRVPPGVSLQ